MLRRMNVIIDTSSTRWLVEKTDRVFCGIQGDLQRIAYCVMIRFGQCELDFQGALILVFCKTEVVYSSTRMEEQACRYGGLRDRFMSTGD